MHVVLRGSGAAASRRGICGVEGGRGKLRLSEVMKGTVMTWVCSRLF